MPTKVIKVFFVFSFLRSITISCDQRDQWSFSILLHANGNFLIGTCDANNTSLLMWFCYCYQIQTNFLSFLRTGFYAPHFYRNLVQTFSKKAKKMHWIFFSIITKNRPSFDHFSIQFKQCEVSFFVVALFKRTVQFVDKHFRHVPKTLAFYFQLRHSDSFHSNQFHFIRWFLHSLTFLSKKIFCAFFVGTFDIQLFNSNMINKTRRWPCFWMLSFYFHLLFLLFISAPFFSAFFFSLLMRMIVIVQATCFSILSIIVSAIRF